MKTNIPLLKHMFSGRGALLIVAGLFLMSAILRLGGDTGQAIAKGVAGLGDGTVIETAQCEPAADLGELVGTIKGRAEILDARERELQELEQSLALARDQIGQKLKDLARAEEELSATIVQVEGAAESDLARLTTVYESMKPKDAATLFEEMAPDFAAGFVGRMRPDVAAQIMAGLAPQTAYSISVILAGRNANAPRE